MFLDFKLVLGITAVFHVFSNLSKIYLFQSGIDKKIALKLGIPAVIAVIIGAILTHYIPQKQTELGMNVLVFCLAIYLLGGGHKKIKQSDSNLYIGGGISGFLAGLIGTGGAIRGLTLSAFQLPKDIFIATSRPSSIWGWIRPELLFMWPMATLRRNTSCLFLSSLELV